MKKFLIKIFLVFTVSLYAQVDIPELTKYATDLTGTLVNNELNFLNRDLKAFYDTTSNQIVFLMIPTLNDYPIEMFSYETADKNKIGEKDVSNGVLFLVVKDDREFRIEVGYGLEGAIPDALAGSILRNEVKPYFVKGDYFSGVQAGLNSLKLAAVGEYKRNRVKETDDDGGGGFGFLVYIIIFIILSLISRGGKGGILGPLLIGSALGSRSRGGFGGGSFGGGGFSGGGGGFGGGGASGGW